MNTYLVSICDTDSNVYQTWIESIKARSLEEAQDKLMNSIVRDYDLDVPADWDDFIEMTINTGLLIGDISDIEEF